MKFILYKSGNENVKNRILFLHKVGTKDVYYIYADGLILKAWNNDTVDNNSFKYMIIDKEYEDESELLVDYPGIIDV